MLSSRPGDFKESLSQVRCRSNPACGKSWLSGAGRMENMKIYECEKCKYCQKRWNRGRYGNFIDGYYGYYRCYFPPHWGKPIEKTHWGKPIEKIGTCPKIEQAIDVSSFLRENNEKRSIRTKRTKRGT